MDDKIHRKADLLEVSQRVAKECDTRQKVYHDKVGDRFTFQINGRPVAVLENYSLYFIASKKTIDVKAERAKEDAREAEEKSVRKLILSQGWCNCNLDEKDCQCPKKPEFGTYHDTTTISRFLAKTPRKVVVSLRAELKSAWKYLPPEETGKEARKYYFRVLRQMNGRIEA